MMERRPRFALGLVAVMLGLSGGPALPEAWAADLDDLRVGVLDLVNRSRREHGLAPLALGAEANAAAQAHADDMRARRYYAHASPEGRSAEDRYVLAGGSRSHATAENIARCADCTVAPTVELVAELHRGWMDSAGHRENILKDGLTMFGFGIAVDRAQGLYAVQVFAGPGLPRDLHKDDRRTALSAEEQMRDAVGRLNQARRDPSRRGLEPSPALQRAALSLLSAQPLDAFALGEGRDVRNALPTGERQSWRSIGALAGICGGCGAVPSAADIRYFVRVWLDDPQYRTMLLEPAWTHVGFAIGADGEGRKVALGVLGQRR